VGDAGTVNAFILFNERESAVSAIVQQLEQRGVSTYFWRRDIPLGEDWTEIEADRLKAADTIVVFLGVHRWGPNHLKLTNKARDLNKRILPVLIGDPPETDFTEAGGLFHDRRYEDLRTPSAAAFSRLAEAIRGSRPATTADFDRLIGLLVDGNEEQRADVLRQIVKSTSIDRTALSVRLRTEITERFSVTSESQFAPAARDPKKLSSIRSWMLSCLIWSNVENPATRLLLFDHLDPQNEPNRQVRFWILAGLYQTRPAYLPEALELCRADGSGEIAHFARAASGPDASVLSDFKQSLAANDFETVWQVLRVLRIVPIPELVPDVVALLNKFIGDSSLTYDALYALTHPDMARAASAVLAEQIESVVARTIAEARMANRTAARAFAVLLAAFDPARVNRALADAAADATTRDVARQLQEYVRESRRDADTGLFVAGYASDTIDVDDDRLNIQEDIQTLTAVMLARDVTPPLAIGLFGDWGSGKSFFMRSIRAAAERMARRAADSGSQAFCSNVVAIEFNAWHYADTNLWASLVGYLLEQLAAYVSPRPTPAEQQAALVNELSSAQAAVAAVNVEVKQAHGTIASRQKALETLQAKRQQAEIRLRDLRLTDLRTILAEDTKLKGELETALGKLGIPPALNTVSELNGVLSDARTVTGQIMALFVSVVTAPNRWLIIGLIVAVIFVIPAVTQRLHELTTSDLFGRAAVLVSQATAVLAGAATVLRQGLATVKQNFAILQTAKQRVDARIAERRQKPTQEEQDLEREIATLKGQEAAASARLQAATARVVELEERLRLLRESGSLARFLSDRTQSEDYRKHLGLISIIRRDFESLCVRLATGQSDIGTGLRRVDRIILFIDDLDRCSASKVIDVLQAVHLLLAYPLFVVVVGVDPRWLLDSLETTYSAFQRDSTSEPTGGSRSKPVDEDVWRVTPQNYLEKIFQIPFSLRPMTSDGYEHLIQGLMKPAPARTGDRQTTGGPNAPGASSAQRAPSASEDRDGLTTPAHSSSPTNTPPTPTAPTTPEIRPDISDKKPAFVVYEDALVVKAWETTFAQRLFNLVPTPRAAKRFSNIYRILKAPVHRDALAEFEGTADFPGDFRVPMLLLAVLIGHPAEAAVLFPKLLKEAAAGHSVRNALQNLASLELESAAFLALERKIQPLVSDSSFPTGPDVFKWWLPRVARFSFEAARVVRAPARDETRAPLAT
jgi:hypothetical protein